MAFQARLEIQVYQDLLDYQVTLDLHPSNQVTVIHRYAICRDTTIKLNMEVQSHVDIITYLFHFVLFYLQ